MGGEVKKEERISARVRPWFPGGRLVRCNGDEDPGDFERDLQMVTNGSEIDRNGVLKHFRTFTLYRGPVVRDKLSSGSNFEEPRWAPPERCSSQEIGRAHV